MTSCVYELHLIDAKLFNATARSRDSDRSATTVWAPTELWVTGQGFESANATLFTKPVGLIRKCQFYLSLVLTDLDEIR